MKTLSDHIASFRNLAQNNEVVAAAVIGELDRLTQLVKDYQECMDDVHRLTRQIDVAIFGEDGAAKQASLCDVVKSVEDVVAERNHLRRELRDLNDYLDGILT